MWTVNGEEISMPLKEFELLEILLRKCGSCDDSWPAD